MEFAVKDSATFVARRFRHGGDRDAPPLALSDEKRAILAGFEVGDSAFSVARPYRDGDRRSDPPWPPLVKGGKLFATFAEGDYRSSDREFSTDHPGPPLLKGGKLFPRFWPRNAQIWGFNRVDHCIPCDVKKIS